MRRTRDHGRVRRALAGLGGIAPARSLAAAGIGADELRDAVTDHAVLRFRKGWYTLFELPAPIVRASRVGGVLTCVSAARHHGLWVPADDERLHVAVPSHASRLRSPGDHHIRLATDADTVVHWSADRMAPYQQVVDVVSAVRAVALCRGAVDGFVVLESALYKRRIGSLELEQLLTTLPHHTREVLSRAGALSAAGSESLLALLFRTAGIPFRQQVFIETVGFVDFVIGERLIVEVDSKAHHSDPTTDRRRDAAASARGYRTLRFMYAQVVYDQGAVLAAVLAAIARGDHRAP